MHIQVVTFHLEGLTEDAYRAACEQVAPMFGDIPGLESKVFLADGESNTYGGVYTWRDRSAMEAFLQSDTFRGVAENPSFVDVRSQDFGVLEEATRLARRRAAAAA